MLNNAKILLGVIGVSLCAFTANADTLRIDVAQGINVNRFSQDENYNDYGIHTNGGIKVMFGFDMTALNDLGSSVTINSFSFSAFVYG
ncbi:MAG: hypothetical protein JKX94_12875, partial [Sneathiella sp.]|nr:hypothetical protein [Sneathiella sp.]